MKSLSKIVIMGLLSSQAFALSLKDVVDLSQVAVGGQACKGARVELYEESAQRGALLIVPNINSLSANAKGGIARVACTIAVPLDLRAGEKLESEGLLVQARAVLPKGAELRLDGEVFEAGSVGVKQSTTVVGKKSGKVELIALGGMMPVIKGPSILRLNSAVLLKNNAKKGVASAKLEALLIPLELK